MTEEDMLFQNVENCIRVYGSPDDAKKSVEITHLMWMKHRDLIMRCGVTNFDDCHGYDNRLYFTMGASNDDVVAGIVKLIEDNPRSKLIAIHCMNNRHYFTDAEPTRRVDVHFDVIKN